jgi:hypothetical protein
MKLEVKKAVPNSGKLDAFLTPEGLILRAINQVIKFSNCFTNWLEDRRANLKKDREGKSGGPI